MNFRFRRAYRGPIQAVIFDWAGTTVDHGCRAPAAVFIEVFRKRGIEVTQPQAREPMGLAKREHIRQLTLMPSVAKQWKTKFGKAATDEDVDSMYREFIPMQLASLPEYSDVIPGVAEFVALLRKQGIKVGATTGYNREMMEVCAKFAAPKGYQPDVSVCADDVPAGRPSPWMAIAVAMKLGVYPMESIVKIGDTYADIDEGLNAGMWSIGITKTGNEIGLSESELAAAAPEEIDRRVKAVEERMYQRGAHGVADSVAACGPILEEITDRLSRGERP